MPYIKDSDREDFDDLIACIVDKIVDEDSDETSRAGMLNYVISSIIGDILDIEGMTYNRINSMVGVLECAKLELYRRLAAPYEDKKMEANGDVYGS